MNAQTEGPVAREGGGGGDMSHCAAAPNATLDAVYDAFMAHSRGVEFNEFDERVCSECGYALAWPEGEDHKYVTPKRRRDRHIAREALRVAGRAE